MKIRHTGKAMNACHLDNLLRAQWKTKDSVQPLLTPVAQGYSLPWNQTESIRFIWTPEGLKVVKPVGFKPDTHI